jgi:hypothetical protein
MEPLPPAAVNVPELELNEYVQSALPSCPKLNVWPATVTLPVLTAVPELGAMAMSTDVLPVALALSRITAQGTEDVAVHAQEETLGRTSTSSAMSSVPSAPRLPSLPKSKLIKLVTVKLHEDAIVNGNENGWLGPPPGPGSGLVAVTLTVAAVPSNDAGTETWTPEQKISSPDSLQTWLSR